ncbi:hypothetical protein B0T24DRAFT_685657 [Lasiosphaeria ovina]|uniref:Uncharacterized protein n=1 Tax=Lasiosphaeria ovina TaxID=92902 RepID=A0AAE0JRX4_9PEZI|nr:hypothetical protein B0T24DRAFT_685657 [Lasiosphaeria ovina]
MVRGRRNQHHCDDCRGLASVRCAELGHLVKCKKHGAYHSKKTECPKCVGEWKRAERAERDEKKKKANNGHKANNGNKNGKPGGASRQKKQENENGGRKNGGNNRRN